MSEYKKVDAVGSLLNNQINGYKVSYGENKDSFLRKSKFTIAIDSLAFPGFITEKIIEPFFCHSVPIYFGDPTVSDYFNENSFIKISDEQKLDEMIERVIELDKDDDKYIEMLMQSPFIDEKHIENLNNSFEQMLLNIVLQDYNNAFRRVREYLPLAHDKSLKEHSVIKNELSEIRNSKWYRIARKIKK